MCESNQELTFDAELTINDKKIEQNTFVENFIAQTIGGMVKSLRGVGDIETLELKITSKA